MVDRAACLCERMYGHDRRRSRQQRRRRVSRAGGGECAADARGHHRHSRGAAGGHRLPRTRVSHRGNRARRAGVPKRTVPVRSSLSRSLKRGWSRTGAGSAVPRTSRRSPSMASVRSQPASRSSSFWWRSSSRAPGVRALLIPALLAVFAMVRRHYQAVAAESRIHCRSMSRTFSRRS
jgi:hypothetical protein